MRHLLPFAARAGVVLLLLTWHTTISNAQVLLDPGGLPINSGLSATSGINIWPPTKPSTSAQDLTPSPWVPYSTQSGSARRSDHRFMRWGLAIGLVAGAIAAGIAAARYGENEGGEFCGQCFVQWAAISVPVGAGVGAISGWLIDKARR
jgi:hypothetical protein